MRVDPSNYVERTLADGRFEREFLTYVGERLNEWDHFIDVGANVGFFSLFVGNRNDDCRVDAFEPAPHSLTRLIENARLNPATPKIRASAVGDYSGEIDLNISHRNPGETTVAETPKSGSGTETVTISVRRLDDCLDGIPDAIKLDIEGAEVAALRGAESILAETPDLLLELHPSNIKELDEDQTEIVDTLSDHGYTDVVRIEDRMDVPLAELGDTTREHTHYHITRR
jgi:FkbM family methyltransferase